MKSARRGDENERTNTDDTDEEPDFYPASFAGELKRTMDEVDEAVAQVNEKIAEVDKMVMHTKELTAKARILFDRWERDKRLRSGGKYKREL